MEKRNVPDWSLGYLLFLNIPDVDGIIVSPVCDQVLLQPLNILFSFLTEGKCQTAPQSDATCSECEIKHAKREESVMGSLEPSPCDGRPRSVCIRRPGTAGVFE